MLTAAMAGESVPAETLRVPRTSWLRRVLSDEALTWSVSRRFAFAAVVVPFVVAGVAIATMPSASAFAWLTSENAPLELSQFVLVAAAAVLFGVLSLILRRRSLGWALLYAIVSLAALVVAGEEISWGQWIFGWETPAAFAERNYQGETNLHNTVAAHEPLKYAVMIAAFYAMAMPLLVKLVRVRRQTYLLVPPLFLVPSFALPFGYRFTRLFLWDPADALPQFADYVIKFAEATETTFYFGVATYAALLLRRERKLRDGESSRYRRSVST